MIVAMDIWLLFLIVALSILAGLLIGLRVAHHPIVHL